MLVLGATATAHAGGYDTPMLYTARHMGMGGAAQAYVDDPSALFHNPAGLMGTERLSIVGDFSLLTGFIQASPGNPRAFGEAGTSIESERTIAPFFLLGVSGRITDWLTAGFAVYPVASAGAEFRFTDDFGAQTTDRTRLVFLELSPGVAFQIPSYPKLSLGIGYRVTIVQLERFQQTTQEGAPPDTGIDFDISGTSFAGLRFGVQWRAYDWLQLGLSYRHKTTTTVEGSGTVVGTEWDYVSTKFTLPSRLAFGLRSDVADFGAALDLEYAFNSQNRQADVRIGTSSDDATGLANISNWSDALTVRAGVEYRLLGGRLPLRLGYVWDQKTSDPTYSSAFGTPPGPTNVVTAGIGWQMPSWSVDLAYAYRWGQATVTDEDFNQRGDKLGECQFCSYPGDYEIRLHGVYVTVAWSWQRAETLEASTPAVMGHDPQPDVHEVPDAGSQAPAASPETSPAPAEDPGAEEPSPEQPPGDATPAEAGASGEDDAADEAPPAEASSAAQPE